MPRGRDWETSHEFQQSVYSFFLRKSLATPKKEWNCLYQLCSEMSFFARTQNVGKTIYIINEKTYATDARANIRPYY